MSKGVGVRVPSGAHGPCSVKVSASPLQGDRGVRIPHVSTKYEQNEFVLRGLVLN